LNEAEKAKFPQYGVFAKFNAPDWLAGELAGKPT
jgi:hypothetical protein